MNNIEDGGPTYPHIACDGHPDYRQGMSLRDQFACSALTALMLGVAERHITITHSTDDPFNDFNECLAKAAYMLADTMLKIRKEA